MEKFVYSVAVVSQIVKDWLKIKMNDEFFSDIDIEKDIVITSEKRLKAEISQDISILNTESSLYLKSLIAHINITPPPIERMITEIKTKSIGIDVLG